jgi:hypothetical protein
MYINGIETGRNEAMALNPSSLGNTTQNYFGRSMWPDPYLAGTLDDFRIYAKRLTAAEISNMVAQFTPVPPSNVAVSGETGNVEVTWTAVPGATTYSIKRATAIAGPYVTIGTNVSGTRFVDKTASHGTFYYVVSSALSDREGVPSSPAMIPLKPAIPTNVIASGWNGFVDLSWASAGGALSYDIKRAVQQGGSYETITNVKTTVYRDSAVANGTRYYYVVSVVGAAGNTDSEEVSAQPIADPELTQWSHSDVGAVGISGNARIDVDNDVFSVHGSGKDLYFQADAFHYLYKQVAGDVGIVARVLSQDNTRSYARAGIMIRESLTTNAVNAAMITTPSGFKEFIWRTQDTVNSDETITGPSSDNLWLRLVRKYDSLVVACVSKDGINWTVQDEQTVRINHDAYIGLVNCAANNAALNTSTFDRVQIATALPDIIRVIDSVTIHGALYSDTIVAINDPYYYGALGLPDGLSIETSTGVVSGIAKKAGLFPVTFIAMNAMGTDSMRVMMDIHALDIRVRHQDGDNNKPYNNVIMPNLDVVNMSGIDIPYQELAIRYWFTPENYSGITTWIDYAELGSTNLSMNYISLSTPRAGANGYIEYRFNPSLANLVSGRDSGPIQSRLANTDWSNFNEQNDYAYRNNVSYAENNHITLYRNGVLIWGIEPDTVASVLNLVLYSENRNSKTNTNDIETYLKLVNGGNTPVDFKDLSVRYWFTKDSNAGLNYLIDYAKLGNANVQGRFVGLQAVTGADTYFELTFKSAAGAFYPLSNTEILYRLSKSDWSKFNETNDYSFLPKAPMAENNHITVYHKGKLVYGTEPFLGGTNGRSASALETNFASLASESLRIEVYPNPVRNRLMLSLGSAVEDASLFVHNSRGQLMMTGKVNGKEHVLDFSNVPQGIYILTVMTNSGRVIKKIVKE